MGRGRGSSEVLATVPEDGNAERKMSSTTKRTFYPTEHPDPFKGFC